MNNLYEFTVKVLPGESIQMPDGLRGAYVPCYAAAPDYQGAIKKGVLALAQMGYQFADLKNGVREIPAESWATYVSNVWPDYAKQMPTPEQLPQILLEGQVFFGPFIGFSSEHSD